MKILFCSDGSTQAEQAVRFGATIAASCQAAVTLLGIRETTTESASLLESLQRSQVFLTEKKVAAQLVIKAGKPIDEILRHTAETAYDLVVIGAVRKQARGAFWLSSKAYELARRIQPPVLLVSGKSDAIRKILICSGGKRHIDPGIRLTGQIARGVGATVTLLHVMPDLPGILAQLPRMSEDTAWLLKSESELGVNLRQGLEQLQGMGVSAQVRLARGDVLEQILREIQQGDYDLLVTGSALSHSLRSYVLGDISREIVNRAHRPVLIVRSQEAGKESIFDFRGWFAKGNVKRKT